MDGCAVDLETARFKTVKPVVRWIHAAFPLVEWFFLRVQAYARAVLATLNAGPFDFACARKNAGLFFDVTIPRGMTAHRLLCSRPFSPLKDA